ncbi:J domain-containing protein [Chloroflexales bacterium ZM16-3]|nr:J domain-containing protein [Chloroflexales bacterium ZM16-3]
MDLDFKDYYTALGVASDADEATIKQAYRALARKHHPDVNPGDQTAEDRFKAINEAYQALGDPERRRTYDALRQEHRQSQQRGGPSRPGGFARGDRHATPSQRAATGGMSPEDLNDIFGDDAAYSDFFRSMFERGQEGGSAPRRGRDAEVLVAITLDEAFHGATRALQIGERRIEARIPPGVRTGARVRLAGQGGAGAAGGTAGDLYLEIEVLPDARFTRDGDDLTTTVAVDVFTAAAGGEARVTTLDGAVLLKIPPRTQADRTFRLRRKGMPQLDQPTERGDLYARVTLVLPDPLSDTEVETLRTFQRARQPATAGRS